MGRCIGGLIFLLIFLQQAVGLAQNPFRGMEALFTFPRHYIAHYTHEPPEIDGDITDTVWRSAPWSEPFVSIKGFKNKKPYLHTQMKIIWNDTYLFIAARLEEPHVWATLKRRDSIIYHDNDFEVFIDPDNNARQYFEIEVNAFNTIFDLFMPKPYRNGSRALISWNIDELKSAVKVRGTLNNPNDNDSGWTVEMAIPFKAISMGLKNPVPVDGAMWRINFSRVQWETQITDGKYIKKKDSTGKPLPEHNWVWSPQGVVNMHYPERWGYLLFSKNAASRKEFTLPRSEQLKRYLWLVYYKQKTFFRQHKKYAWGLEMLSVPRLNRIKIGDKTYHLQLVATDFQFTAFIYSSSQNGFSINQEGLVQKLNVPL